MNTPSMHIKRCRECGQMRAHVSRNALSCRWCMAAEDSGTSGGTGAIDCSGARPSNSFGGYLTEERYRHALEESPELLDCPERGGVWVYRDRACEKCDKAVRL